MARERRCPHGDIAAAAAGPRSSTMRALAARCLPLGAMDTLTGVQIASCGLLALGGVLKLLRPDPGRTALARLGLRLARCRSASRVSAKRSLGAGHGAAGGRPSGWRSRSPLSASPQLALRCGGWVACRPAAVSARPKRPPGPVHVVVTGLASVVAAPPPLQASPGHSHPPQVGSRRLGHDRQWVAVVEPGLPVPGGGAPVVRFGADQASARDLARSGRP